MNIYRTKGLINILIENNFNEGINTELVLKSFSKTSWSLRIIKYYTYIMLPLINQFDVSGDIISLILVSLV